MLEQISYNLSAKKFISGFCKLKFICYFLYLLILPMATCGRLRQEDGPLYPHACRKRRLKWGGFSEYP